ncbi:MAG: hypothetical protein ACRD5G_04545 [Candidatus Acidiferrales bacterium]
MNKWLRVTVLVMLVLVSALVLRNTALAATQETPASTDVAHGGEPIPVPWKVAHGGEPIPVPWDPRSGPR